MVGFFACFEWNFERVLVFFFLGFRVFVSSRVYGCGFGLTFSRVRFCCL